MITESERSDLLSVAGALGLSSDEADACLNPSGQPPNPICLPGGFLLRSGDAVVFTGEAPGIDRVDLEYQARSLGLRPTGYVSAKTCLVVAADPDSLSGKARKARELGVPIVDYVTYIAMLCSLRC